MDERSFSKIKTILNRSLKPGKFGPRERMEFAVGFPEMWSIMLEEGTEDQQEFFKKKFTKFCELYGVPVPEFPDVPFNEEEITEAINEVVEQENN